MMCNLSIYFLQTCRVSTNSAIHRRCAKIRDNSVCWSKSFSSCWVKFFISSISTHLLVESFQWLEMLSHKQTVLIIEIDNSISTIWSVHTLIPLEFQNLIMIILFKRLESLGVFIGELSFWRDRKHVLYSHREVSSN